MKGIKWTAGILAATLCLGAAGCGIQTGTEGQRRPEAGSQGSQAGTKLAEQETVKPTSPQPQEIEPFPDNEKEVAAERLKGGKRIILMTDIHYLSSSLTDMGEGFQSMVDHGDGKLTNYVWEITDAALEQIKLQTPDVLILSGDLTLQG